MGACTKCRRWCLVATLALPLISAAPLPAGQGVNIRVNMKRRGDVFGEVALMFNSPRSATVAATQNSVVWVLERDAFRQYVREVHETESSQLELFLNSGGCWRRLAGAAGCLAALLLQDGSMHGFCASPAGS